MKKITKVLLALVFVISIFSLTGCNKKSVDSKLFGTWQYEETIDEKVIISSITFKKDGTGSEINDIGNNETNQDFTYEVKNNKIIITYDEGEDEIEYKYKFDGEKLILRNTFDDEFVCEKEEE